MLLIKTHFKGIYSLHCLSQNTKCLEFCIIGASYFGRNFSLSCIFLLQLWLDDSSWWGGEKLVEFYTKVQCTVTATELPTDDNDNGGGGDIRLLAPLSALVGFCDDV